MSVDPRLLIHVELETAEEELGRTEGYTLPRIDMISKRDLFGMRLSERDHRFMIDSHRTTFTGQNRKAGALFRAQKPEKQLPNQLLDVRQAWTHDEAGWPRRVKGYATP